MTFVPKLQLRDFTGGINTKQRPNKIKDNQLKSIISMDFVANSVQRAQGYTVLGTEPDNTLTGKTLYSHKILAGTEVLVKTIGTYIKYLDAVDNTWYKMTLSTFTTGLRWTFSSFNGFLYGNDGIDNWIYWAGSSRSTLVNAITPASVTIELQTGHGGRFPNSGNIMIQDDLISYTGKAGDQLTGVTGIAVNHPAGSTVILELDSSTYSGLTKSKQINFFKNRNYAVDYDTPNIIRHSKLATNTNPETTLVNFAVAGGAGDAGFGIAPAEIISAKVYITGNQSSVLACLCKDGVVYSFVVTDTTTSTVNAFVPMRTMNSYPYAKQMVAIVENDLALADQFGYIRTLSYGDINTPITVKTISQNIEPSLEVMDFSDGCMKYFKRKLYIVGKTQNAVTNDITWFHDANYSAWGAYGHWDAIDLEIYNDNLYALSAFTGDVWKLNDGYSANGEIYSSEAVLKDFDFGVPLMYKSALKMRLSGFITNNCKAYLDFYFDNNTQPMTFLIDGDNTKILGALPNVAVGSVVFGPGVFGGGLPNGVARKDFVAQLQFNDIATFLKLTIKIRIDSQDVDFEMNDGVIFARLEGEELWKNQQTLSVQ